MTTCTDFDIRQTTLEEQQLYDHLLNCVQVELPTQLIERFQRLLIDGAKYVDPKVWLALEKLATSKRAEQDFKFVLNRCCHILINHWQMQPQLQGAIPELVALFEKPPEPTRIPSRSARRLRHLVQLFTETEQYRTLRRLSQVMSGTAQASSNESREVGTFDLSCLNQIM